MIPPIQPNPKLDQTDGDVITMVDRIFIGLGIILVSTACIALLYVIAIHL